MKKTFYMVLAAVAVSGCSGTLTTTVLPQDTIRPGWVGRGIVAYPTAYFWEDYVKTTVVKDGKVSGDCIHQPAERRLGIHADYSRPMLISYDPGLLESYKFGVMLGDDGALKSVNLDSTPDQGNTLKNLSSAATNFASMAALRAERPAEKPLCTDGAVLVKLTRYKFPGYYSAPYGVSGPLPQ
ncbi:MAG TPA: hypothetical protein VFX06_04800 [Stellaceae bacterium]|nr:hypothetical protein [Stellaceae bacterium]